MLKKNIKSCSGELYTIESDDEIIIDWFNRPDETHTDIIIEQLNSGMYDEFFSGKKDLTVIDAGANIGLFSIYVFDACKKVIAVEPAPHNCYVFQHLLDNLENVILDASALHNENTTIPFYIHSSPTCNSSVNVSEIKVEVPTKTIKTIIDDHELETVDFVKCDIEGSEILAITEKTVSEVSDKVKVWWVEVHQTNTTATPWPGNLEQNRRNLAAIFQNCGYNTKFIIHDQLLAWK